MIMSLLKIIKTTGQVKKQSQKHSLSRPYPYKPPKNQLKCKIISFEILFVDLFSLVQKISFDDENGFRNDILKKIVKCCLNLDSLEMSFRQIQDSGLIELAKLQNFKKIITKKDSLCSVTQNGLTKFFHDCKNLEYVDISGATSMSQEAIHTLADQNSNLKYLFLDTYLLPGSVIKYVINRCKISIFKFTPSLIITKHDIANIKKYC